MIIIDVPNLTDRQLEFLDILWNFVELEEVENWIASLETEELRQEAKSMEELILLAVTDIVLDVDLAKKELDRIFSM